MMPVHEEKRLIQRTSWYILGTLNTSMHAVERSRGTGGALLLRNAQVHRPAGGPWALGLAGDLSRSRQQHANSHGS